jgi:hypothetical protein
VDSQATNAPAQDRARQAQAPRWTRAVACVCFDITGPGVLPGHWRPGPLPVALPDGRRAHRHARSSYFQARAADSLYGPGDRTSQLRWHRSADTHRIDEGAVLGIELLRFPRYATAPGARDSPANGAGAASRYLCVIHLALDLADPLTGLAAAVRLNPREPGCARRRDRYGELAGTGFHIPEQVRRGLSVSMLTFDGELPPAPGAPKPWTAATGWLWAAASATPFRHFTPDAEDPHVLDGLVYLSSSWRALVLRDGIGFLGLLPDRCGKDSFFAWGECYARSLYTDVLLLATLERDALDDFANRLAHIGNRFEKSREFRRLVNQVTEFRNIFWWETVTRHGNANTILEQLHAAHRTPQLFDRIIADLDAFRQQVEAQALEASLQVQERQEKRAGRFEHAVSVAAVTVTLPALVFTALALPIQGITSDGHNLSAWLIIALGLGSMLIGAIAGTTGARWTSK